MQPQQVGGDGEPTAPPADDSGTKPVVVPVHTSSPAHPKVVSRLRLGGSGSVNTMPRNPDEHSAMVSAREAVVSELGQTWSGNFADENVELEFQKQRWVANVVTRRAAIAAIVAAGLVHAIRSASFVLPREQPAPFAAIPSVLCVATGIFVLCLGLRRDYMPRRWDALATAGMLLIAIPMLIMYPLLLCDHMDANDRELHSQCITEDTDKLPWSVPVVLILVSVVLPGGLGCHWLYTLVATCVATVTVMSVVSSMSSVAMAFPVVSLLLIATATTTVARSQDNMSRFYWRSLKHTARAFSQQRAAELKQYEASKSRDAAKARMMAFQNVMRYVCHELRNPLHGIMGLMEGVQPELECCPRWVQEDVEAMAQSAASMAVILNDVLDLGQLQRGQMKLSPEPTDCAELIDKCIMANKGIASVPITSRIDRNLPHLLMLDPLRVSQIITNAVSNAAKLTKRGNVEVCARYARNKLVFEVTDTGCGLSADAPKLFQPYAQDNGGKSRATRSRFQRGTGLGLAISMQLVNLMEGDVGLENREDGVRGARFWVSIPCKPPNASALQQQLQQLSSEADGNASGGGGMMDADRVVRKVLPPTASLEGERDDDGGSVDDTSSLSSPRSGGGPPRQSSSRSLVLPLQHHGSQRPAVQRTIHSKMSWDPQQFQLAGITVFRSHQRTGESVASSLSSPSRSRRSQGSVLSTYAPVADVPGPQHAMAKPGAEATPASASGPHHGVAVATAAAPTPAPAPAPAPVPARSPTPAPAPSAPTISQQALRRSASGADAGAGPEATSAAAAEPAAAPTASPVPDAVATPTPAPVDERAAERRARKERRRRKKVDSARARVEAAEFAGVHVLVVDDERINRTVLKRHCSRTGCTVRLMTDGEQLLSLLDTPGGVVDNGRHLFDAENGQRIDAVFLDIMMQRSNGEEVVKALRQRGVTTPVVAATGNGVQEDLDRYGHAGFSGVLLKPFLASTVADLLRTLVVTHAKAKEAAAQ